jgi:hypothetical protein
MPDNFTRQGESAATQWVKNTFLLHFKKGEMGVLEDLQLANIF